MTEYRRLPRSQLLFHLDVQDARSHKPVGRLVDISPGGLRVLGDAPMAPGRRCRLALDMPVDIGGQGALEFDAVVVWSKSMAGYGRYTTGFGELGLDDAQRDRLETAIAAYADGPLL